MCLELGEVRNTGLISSARLVRLSLVLAVAQHTILQPRDFKGRPERTQSRTTEVPINRQLTGMVVNELQLCHHTRVDRKTWLEDLRCNRLLVDDQIA